MGSRLVVFTDLDGTLLDHTSYDWQPARPALDRLRSLGIPLILCSSKTAAEMRVLREEIGVTDPYICENGAVVVFPATGDDKGQGEDIIRLGAGREDVLCVLEKLRARGFRFIGFSGMTDRAVAESTGLTLEAAGRARERSATEPVLWKSNPSELQAFERALGDEGLQVVQGGRFHHVMGQFDKADAMRELLRRYRAEWPGHRVVSVALGDSPNDQKMLQYADIPVVIKGVRSALIVLADNKKAIYSHKPGPGGWNDCVLEILAGYDNS